MEALLETHDFSGTKNFTFLPYSLIKSLTDLKEVLKILLLFCLSVDHVFGKESENHGSRI